MKNKLKALIIFLLKNFGPILGFYVLNHFFGYRIATIVSLVLVAVDYALLKMRKEKITLLFWAFNSVIIVFGLMDLFFDNQLFIKYEAFLTNAIIAVFWGASVFKEKSIVQELAESQKRTSTDQSEDKRFFFNVFTLFWAAYFLLKGFFYLWTYQNSTLESAFMVRIFVGKISLWVMMAISILLPKKIWKAMEKAGVFPSQRRALITERD